jgi:D-alanyl-D-alanine carboxypeptidase
MRYAVKFSIIITFFTVFFLFNPGNSYFYNLFAFNYSTFNRKEVTKKMKFNPVVSSKNESSLSISAQGAYIVDLASFTPVYEKNTHMKLYPASTTKVITALVVRDLYKPDDVITIKKVHSEGQVMGLVPGERITVENLLYGLLIYSGNDAAFAFADAYGYDKFIALMNKKAASLHMVDTHFVNPAGLDANGQVTTPFDLSLASRQLLKDEFLKKVVSIKEITISDIDFKYFHQLNNVNKLLGNLPGIGGLKTGYTEEAGENLVSFYKKDEHEFLIVILKSGDRFADTTSVVRWINENVQYTKP